MISLYRRVVLVHHGANQPIYGEVAFHKPLVKTSMPKLRRVVFGFHNLRACSHSYRVSNVLLHNTFILMVYSRIGFAPILKARFLSHWQCGDIFAPNAGVLAG